MFSGTFINGTILVLLIQMDVTSKANSIMCADFIIDSTRLRSGLYFIQSLPPFSHKKHVKKSFDWTRETRTFNFSRTIDLPSLF
jgi:hypothetical protein